MPKAYIGLGSNLGNKEKNLLTAIDLIAKKNKINKISNFYKTEPVGYQDQDWFLNGAIEIETDLSPQELLNSLQTIEKKLKRKKTIKNGPRTIDLDIIIYDDLEINTPDLIIPHPRWQDREFVIKPLKDITSSLPFP